MIARELMTKNPFSVTPKTSIHEAIEIMMDRDFRHLPVVENGELVGLLSDRDLRRYSWDILISDPEGGRSRLKGPVSNVMTADVLSVGPEADAAEVIDIMLEEKVGAVPVVDDSSGDLVGIISIVDVIKFARDTL